MSQKMEMRTRNVQIKPKEEVTTLYKCKVCNKEFTGKHNLQVHTAIHEQNNLYKCTQCSYECKVKKYLTRHALKVHGVPTAYMCPVCGKMFHFKTNMTSHMRVHTGEKPYKCKDCGKAFRYKYTLSSHMLIHKDLKPFKCSYCQYACRDSSSLRKHVARHTGTIKFYHCKICYKRFEANGILKTHIEDVHTGANRHPCDICGGMYKTKATLSTHIQTIHLKTKRCSCSVCGRSLSSAANLPAHLRSHSPLRPHRCPHAGCAKRYKDTSSLKKHALIHNPDMQYACEICDRKFTRLSRFNKHILQHVPKKKTVICDYCGVDFYNKRYLINHIERKHGRKGQRYECDICGLVTTNKPSIVMHLKHKHKHEDDRECRICHTMYKTHMYLKLHYLKSHHIRYKMKQRPKKISVTVKIEPVEEEVEEKKEHLLEIQKEEVVDIGEFEAKQDGIEISTTDIKMPEKISEEKFEEFFEKNVVVDPDMMGKEEDSSKPIIDWEHCYTKQYCPKLTTESSRHKKALALEETRQQYNERMSAAANRSTKDKVNITFFNKKQNNENSTESLNDLNNGNSNNDDGNMSDGNDSLNDECDPKKMKTNGKIKLNIHQCYICFKLFETKSKLIEHCKEHFDICNENTLKKCPLCTYVTTLTVTRHLKLVHKMDIKVAYGKINDKKTNANGSRYTYNINDSDIKELEIIPSIKNLNKKASMKFDERNKIKKDKSIGKTLLVRKGKEWVVERENINIDKRYILPEFDPKDVNMKLGDTYLDNLKNLYRIAKKSETKMLFPCDKCEKICQTLSALKLHSRRHDDTPKPFKKKVWKHKKKNTTVKEQIVKVDNKHRFAQPTPIKGKHKCDDKLKEFYESNIKGGNIEFWQFLKIYNKMGRENIEDFKDLEGRTDFGIHPKFAEAPKKVKKVRKVKNCFTRTIMLSKRQHLRRIAMIRQLREEIADRKNSHL